MQPRTDPAYRPGLTNGDVFDLITASNIKITTGCELLDRNLVVLGDISDGFIDGKVMRGNNDTIHGKCDVTIETELDWGTAIIRPYMKIETPGPGGKFGRWNLGAYFTSTPEYVAGTFPRSYDIQGYDGLQALNDLVGDSYIVPVGKSYLKAVEDILIARGFSQYVIDQSRASTVFSQARAWPIDETTTWLNVINDLLAAVGYRGMWADWDGRLRAEPYDPPSARASEWLYDTYKNQTILIDRKRTQDYFDAPNRWIAVRSNLADGAIPIEGNGVYTFINQNNGKTSVAARERVITKVMSIEAADQSALIQTAGITIDADQRIDSKFDVTTGPNPLHWHFDRLSLLDPEFGAPVEVQEDSWELPLNGDDMQHSWKSV